jgi:hypothetical protein
MANMTLSGYSFLLDPERVSGLDADSLVREKSYAEELTLTGSVLWQWETCAAGNQIVLEWEHVKLAQWNELQRMVNDTTLVTFNPQIGGTTFTVAPLRLEAERRTPTGMQNVRLTMSVRS